MCTVTCTMDTETHAQILHTHAQTRTHHTCIPTRAHTQTHTQPRAVKAWGSVLLCVSRTQHKETIIYLLYKYLLSTSYVRNHRGAWEQWPAGQTEGQFRAQVHRLLCASDLSCALSGARPERRAACVSLALGHRAWDLLGAGLAQSRSPPFLFSGPWGRAGGGQTPRACTKAPTC